jgi:hypothetical protein
MWWRWLLLILLLLPPLACAAGWVRSRFAQDLAQVYHDHSGAAPAFLRIYTLRSDGGVVAFEIDHTDLSRGLFGGRPETRPAEAPSWSLYGHRGIAVHNNYGDPAHRRWGVPVGYQFKLQFPQGFITGKLTEADAIGWYRMWWAPHWMVMIVTALPAMLLSRRLARGAVARRRRSRGQCAACGYDLRASPDRCPECGAAGAAGAVA